MSFGVLFPGQGSQFVGMGAGLFEAKPDLLGEGADTVLGWSLRDVCLDGPEDLLTRTEYAQPALFALSYAIWEMFRDRVPDPPAGAAGHSLGEYTALAAAGCFGFYDALDLVARRGRAMASAAAIEPSGMAALIGADAALASHVADTRNTDGGRLAVDNINAPGQVVVAGGADDIIWLSENSRALGVRRVIPLKVAGAFHSSFMKSAASEVGEAIANVAIAPPEFPVWSNTTARQHDHTEIGKLLVRQVVSPVRFEETLVDMASSGISTFVHVGPGDVTAGMAKRSLEGAEVMVVSDVDDIDGAATTLIIMQSQE